MSDVNKAILGRHFNEVLNQGELAVIDEIYADDYVLDAPVQTEGSVQAHGETHGRDGLKKPRDLVPHRVSRHSLFSG